MAPRRTGSPGTEVGRTAGRARQSRGTSAATRAASSPAARLCRPCRRGRQGRGRGRRRPRRRRWRRGARARRGTPSRPGACGSRARSASAAATASAGVAPPKPCSAARVCTARPPARACSPALLGCSFPAGKRRAVHGHPADLARGAADAPAHLAVDDRGEAEAGAEPHEREVVEPGRDAVGALGHRGEVHVVLDHHRGVQHLAQRVEHALVPGGEVHREPRRAGPRVEHAGDADARRRTARRSRCPALSQARPMASRTMPTGSSAPLGSTLTSATGARSRPRQRR